MENPVGFRFRPTDEEIVDHYLRPKNVGSSNTRHVDGVISTVDICSFDPWELPAKSMIKSGDYVWYFFGCKMNKYKRGDRQSRKTNSGFWKKTGVTMDIIRKRGNREKIGEKRVLVFHFSKILGGSKSNWVMHEYHSSIISPNQMMTYTICKVMFKGEEREFSSASGFEIDHSHSLIPHMNNSGALCTETVGSSLELIGSQELQNPRQFRGFLNEQEETQFDEAMRRAFDNIPIDDFKSLFDDAEQSKIVSIQEDRNDYIPKKPLTGVFVCQSSDDSDFYSISAATSCIETSSTCDSFGSSNHRIDQITDLQESPSSTIKLVSSTQEVSKVLGTSTDTSEKKKNLNDDAQGCENEGIKMGQEMIKKKRAGSFYRIIQRIIKKFQFCSSISRT